MPLILKLPWSTGSLALLTKDIAMRPKPFSLVSASRGARCSWRPRRQGNPAFGGRFEEIVLLALVRLREDAYGVTIRRDIAERTGSDVSFGAVYTTLERLERKGYVKSRVGEPTPERGGRAKKYFRIEAPGIRALNETREMVANMGGLAHAG
jgi:PadR family transcriptional regulator, regulatory protein PadR